MNQPGTHRRRPAVIGMISAIMVFFLAMLIHAQLRSDSHALGPALATFAATAVPGGLLAWWLAGRPRR
ncbi:hypothetical protein [Streptomyces sp. NPDC048111]|uniref:hypothetical protein n=1 Tax=Streptomyces sp. NPDC048111 TaxID=3365500 RepID=UPI003710E38E